MSLEKKSVGNKIIRKTYHCTFLSVILWMCYWTFQLYLGMQVFQFMFVQK